MTRIILAALVALSLLPSVATAQASFNVAETPSGVVYTYTLRAKSTDRSYILPSHGATSCSVDARISTGGNTLVITPRSNPAAVEAGTTINTTGTSTFTPGNEGFTFQFLSVDSSTATVACDTGSGGGGQAVEGEVDVVVTSWPDRAILYGDSITADSLLDQVDSCDWCAPLNTAGVTVVNAANNGARVSNRNDGGNCEVGNGYTNCLNGPEQILPHPTSGVCQRGTAATPLNLYGDASTDELTCVGDLGVSSSDVVVYSLAINDIMQGQAIGFHTGAPNSFYDQMINDFQLSMDEIVYNSPASCVVTLMPPRWRGVDGDDNYIQRNANLREYQDDIIPLINARYPRCEVVDVFQAFLDVETNDGEAAMLALYRDAGNIFTSVCPGKGLNSPPSDCLHPNLDGSLFMGELIAAGVQRAHAKNLPGARFAGSPLKSDFNEADPFYRGLESRDNLTYDVASASVQVIDSAIPGAFVLDGVELNSSDQVCVAELFGGQSVMESACLFRQARDGSGTVPVALVNGSGIWTLGSYTGSTFTQIDAGVGVSEDFGNLGPDDCMAQSIEGTGTDTVIKTWLADCSAFTGATEGAVELPLTCTGGLYGTTATAPGCTADVEVDFSTFTDIPGKGIGRVIRDVLHDGTDGVRMFYAEDKE